MKPLLDRILIKPDDAIADIGGLMLQTHERNKPRTGTVVAVGPGMVNQNITLQIKGDAIPEVLARVEELITLIKQPTPVSVQPGDRVMFGLYSGTKVLHRGQEVLFIRESDILSILEDNENTHA